MINKCIGTVYISHFEDIVKSIDKCCSCVLHVMINHKQDMLYNEIKLYEISILIRSLLL